jgi:hypothetical protein
LFFLSKKDFDDRVDELLKSLSMTHGVGVRSIGRGGLALLWNDDINVKLQSYDRLHIDVVILDPITTLRSGASQVSMVR